jgi:translation elongation factor P/translation initiation factor 5A
MKKLQILISLMLLASILSYGQNPKNLAECNAYFDRSLKPKDIIYIQGLSADGLSSLHMGLGMTIRNSWICGNRSPELVKYFNDMEIFHPDDISTIIIKNYWYYLNGKVFDINADIAHYKEYWRKSRESELKMQKTTDDLEKRISDSYLDIKYKDTNSFVLRLPNYNNDNNVFSNEFIKYKNGYIINSMTTIPGGSKTGINYRYYYIDLKTNQLSKLSFKGFDSVQSVTTMHSTLYIAGKKNNKLKIIAKINEKEILMSLAVSEQKAQKLKNKSWIKLGVYNDTLFALQSNGLLFYTGRDWKFKNKFDFEGYFKANYNALLIPTENIRLTSKKMYFLQEVLQMRDCDLFELDFKKNTVSEFWQKHTLVDDYKEEICTYTVLDDNTLFLASDRAGENILLSEKDSGFNTYLLDGKVKLDSINDLRIRKVIKNNNHLFLLGENGLFDLKDNEIKRLVTFENTEQIIGKNRCHFKFYPRSCEIINEDEYLIGGMFGGLYRINLKQKTIICLDDNESLQTIDVLNSSN